MGPSVTQQIIALQHNLLTKDNKARILCYPPYLGENESCQNRQPSSIDIRHSDWLLTMQSLYLTKIDVLCCNVFLLEKRSVT